MESKSFGGSAMGSEWDHNGVRTVMGSERDQNGVRSVMGSEWDQNGVKIVREVCNAIRKGSVWSQVCHGIKMGSGCDRQWCRMEWVKRGRGDVHTMHHGDGTALRQTCGPRPRAGTAPTALRPSASEQSPRGTRHLHTEHVPHRVS